MNISFTPARLAAAQRAVAAAGLDAILLTPGADLRYLTGYAAHQLERLTCLVLPADGDITLIVPTAGAPGGRGVPGAGHRPAHRRPRRRHRPVPAGRRRARRRCGRDRDRATATRRRVGIGNRMWAEHSLALRDALPDMEQRLAGPVLRELRMRKSAAEIEALAEAGAAIDAVHARMGEWLSPGRTEAEVGARHRGRDPGGRARECRLRHRGQRPERRQPAPRDVRPGDRGRRPGRRRHRRHDAVGLLLRLDPHLRRRRHRRRPSSSTTTRCCRRRSGPPSPRCGPA